MRLRHFVIASAATLLALSTAVTIGSGGATAAGASTVVAWGSDFAGESIVPADLTDAVAVTGGSFSSLALRADGTVAHWGAGPTPPALNHVVAIAAREAGYLALKDDGTVVGWGVFETGEPVPPGLSGVTAISVGSNHGLVLKNDGTVAAWGSDLYHQTEVPAGLTGVTAISAGGYHNLALRSGGVVAWGDDGYGQSTVPAAAESGVIAIAAGQMHSLALKSDGTVVAWGYQTDGENQVPSGLSGVTAIAAGNHSLALKSDGTVVAWGWDDYGQTGVPAGLSGVTAIGVGWGHSLVVVGGAPNDTTPPTVTSTAPTAPFTLATMATLRWKGSDAGSGLAGYQAHYRRASVSSGFGPWISPRGWGQLASTTTSVTLTGLTLGNDYCFQVRGRDKAGNWSRWTAARCTARPLDDRGLTFSTGWTRASDDAYWNRTVTRTKTAGATAKRTNVALDRLGIVATRGPGMGMVGVYVGTKLIRKISLAAAGTHYRSLVTVPKFTYRTGTVRVKVLTSGKPVQLDGLAVSRT